MITRDQISKSKQLADENLYLLSLLPHLGKCFISLWGQFHVHIYNQSLHLTWQAVTFYAICKLSNMPNVTCQSKNTFHNAHLGGLNSSFPACLKYFSLEPNKMDIKKTAGVLDWEKYSGL